MASYNSNSMRRGGQSRLPCATGALAGALPWRHRGGAPDVVPAQFRCISDDPLGVSGVRGLVVALILVVSAPIRFVSDDTFGVSGGLVVMPKLVVSAPFRFVGLVVTPKVTTITLDAGCCGTKTGSFGTISMSRRRRVTSVTVDARS